MIIGIQIANNLRGLFFGENRTSVNIKDNLENLSWEQATTKVYEMHTIAELVFHIDYYVVAVLSVLKGNSLDAHDKYSFDLPPINSEDDWKKLVRSALDNALVCASLIEKLEDGKMEEPFVKEKYGNYYQNLTGIIEHAYYHLGQITLLKKIILSK